MYYVPSLLREIIFKELTIGQFMNIYNNAKTSFNVNFSTTLINNCTESVDLTDFDKYILLLQIHLKEIKNFDIIKKEIPHPKKQNLTQGLYNIDITVPALKEEIQWNSFTTTFKSTDKNILLLIEIAKHINSITLNNTVIDLNTNYKEKIDIVKKIPPDILANCITLIDNNKKEIKNYYTLNKVPYNYNISLLVP
jgi:hypothetical protein